MGKIKLTRKTKYRKSKTTKGKNGHRRCSSCGRYIWMKFFEFTKTDYNKIVDECMLDEEYQRLLEYKIKGYSIAKMARLLGTSEATISVMVSKLKKKIKRII